MGKLKKIAKALDCFGPSSWTSTARFDKDPLIASSNKGRLPTLEDGVNGSQSLAFQLKPMMVTLRVSMHCKGCARKVEKHISKMEGVRSFTVDLETKMVIVIGDILPYEVVESVSKVKSSQLWQSSLP
ncbi:protein SODIUM POTASSIUM ROOT DEFECTIVE 2-like [Cucurbita pepo subsp. pepo]|uniref:protein SODIUM POTASSIUM ROOT DEFECTIVE 2-like n=1 Tax=Cucurbita pepo subsp. pepo TaxID=3664 RepID=UPI000C9D703C|nr:protein SODIUM POTASSIUM ROOT DEFECTIVE 2-like [Cucurbita pepo subsp. pepo]